MKVRLLFIGLFACVVLMAQKPLFKNGDRVCFVGNSITYGGEFHHNIYLYGVTRYPKERVEFYNCGISGDVCSGILKRMNGDILSHNPTHVVIKIGMNDVNRGLYAATPTLNADTLQKRALAISTYKTKLDTIVKIFLSKNIQVILQKPTIYDQTAVLKRQNNLGVNDALKQCADFIQTLSDKYHLPVVDYWTILNDINKDLQKKDSTASIVGADRVHPGAVGHMVMAYQFLKDMHQSGTVATIVIDKDVKASNKVSENCVISNYVKNKNETSFTVKEFSLPYPTSEGQQPALALVPMIETFSVEKLVVKKLQKGMFTLTIDDSVIGKFSNTALDSGVNLSLYRNTPQYKQAEQVRAFLSKMWKAEGALRTIDYVEIKHLGDYKGDRNDVAALKVYLDDLFKNKLSDTKYYKIQFDNYISVKPNQQKLKAEADEMRNEAYKTAEPKEHVFKVVPSI